MMPPCRRLRRQLAALQSSAAAPPTPPPLALPLEAIEPEREVDGAALQYQRSGYTIVRDIVPAPLLRELQGRFEEHTADYHREHGEQGRFELEALREDEVFGRLASLLTEHPVVQRGGRVVAVQAGHRPQALRQRPLRRRCRRRQLAHGFSRPAPAPRLRHVEPRREVRAAVAGRAGPVAGAERAPADALHDACIGPVGYGHGRHGAHT